MFYKIIHSYDNHTSGAMHSTVPTKSLEVVTPGMMFSQHIPKSANTVTLSIQQNILRLQITTSNTLLIFKFKRILTINFIIKFRFKCNFGVDHKFSLPVNDSMFVEKLQCCRYFCCIKSVQTVK